ncbi:unnamed protein product [Rhizophagus irregularis]|nr:unnamed protein product [Rhizophagus irregularis]
MQDTENKNEWIKWIEEAVDKEHIKYYEYKEFNNFQEIGTGEIIRELKNQREVDYHDNIIRCHGITKFESIEYHVSNNYMLVMEYANNGSLRSYLEKNFGKITWDDKYIMAYQLACAVSCLHNEGIVHRDLFIKTRSNWRILDYQKELERHQMFNPKYLEWFLMLIQKFLIDEEIIITKHRKFTH